MPELELRPIPHETIDALSNSLARLSVMHAQIRADCIELGLWTDEDERAWKALEEELA